MVVLCSTSGAFALTLHWCIKELFVGNDKKDTQHCIGDGNDNVN